MNPQQVVAHTARLGEGDAHGLRAHVVHSYITGEAPHASPSAAISFATSPSSESALCGS